MDAKDKLFAEVASRLARLKDGDLSLALEPEALTQFHALVKVAQSGKDRQADYLLGWLRWYRSQALPAQEGEKELGEAVSLLGQCFIAGCPGDYLPYPLLSKIAGWVAHGAVIGLEFALEHPELDMTGTAADQWRRIVAISPAADRDRASHLTHLAVALQAVFEQTGAADTLDEAIEACKKALTATEPGDPDLARRASNLGVVLRSRFKQAGDPQDLEWGIKAARAAVKAASASERPRFLVNLAGSLQVQFEHDGDYSALDEAISASREGLALGPEPTEQAALLSGLGNALLLKYEGTAGQDDLDQAVQACQAAIAATPAGHPHLAKRLSNLSAALMRRFLRAGDPADINESVSMGRDALAAFPADHSERASALNNLAAALMMRFERTGERSDLDEAIETGMSAVAATPVGHGDRASRLANVGAALRRRFVHFGGTEDLTAGIEAGRAATTIASPGQPAQAMMRANLSAALEVRSQETGHLRDLDEAVALAREAVAIADAGHPDRRGLLTCLSEALLSKFMLAGDRPDLDAAIDAATAAVTGMSDKEPGRAWFTGNLGMTLRTRFALTGNRADLDAAIDAMRQAATGEGYPLYGAAIRNGLGSALAARYQLTGAPEDRRAATAAYIAAADTPTAEPSTRIKAARSAAALLADADPARAADLIETAVRLLPDMAPERIERRDRQRAISEIAGLPDEAAALALANTSGTTSRERATRALRLLEASRAVLISQALDARSDLTDLRRADPHLALRFTNLRAALDQPVDNAEAFTALVAGRAPADGLRPDRHRLAVDLADTLASIRALDGFSSFGLPPPASELLAQGRHGPVVTFTVSQRRSAALILAGDGIDLVELPGLRYQDLIDQISEFRQALDTSISITRKEFEVAQSRLVKVLEWLWDNAAEPVLHALGITASSPSQAPLPQVWWAPGGLLGQLPVHAAGYHTDPPDQLPRRTVMDHVVSSYTPTVRALRYSREHTVAREITPRSLIVAMPSTPGLPGLGKLVHVAEEAARLSELLPSPVTLIEDAGEHDAPTKDDVLNRLPEVQIAHFACHGHSDPADPSQSFLLLRDHGSDPLTVASLVRVSLGQAELAYLSACSTALISTPELADEAIHLTSAFQLAGFPHVIGTLWEINDYIAVTVAERFYTCLRAQAGQIEADRAARCLHAAVRTIRNRRPATPFLWASYLHAGA